MSPLCEGMVSRSPFRAHSPSQAQVDACKRKNKYTYAVVLLRCEQRHPKSPELRPYHCPVCGWWHLTSKR